MTERETRLIRKLSERWCKELGYRSACDHPTESSFKFLNERLTWLLKKTARAQQDDRVKKGEQ